MTSDRRRVIRWIIGLCLGAAASVAWSQAFPSRPIRMIVPYPPGGAVDPIARTIAQKLTESWGQPVVVDNKPGAGTIIGTDSLAKAAPDGYTVILASSNHAVNPAMYAKMPYDPVKDFAPISLVSIIPVMLSVNPKLAVTTQKELIELLKVKPGSLNYSSTGNGSTSHLAGELFKSMAGVSMVHVPYKGSGPSVMATIAGETSVVFDSIFSQLPQVKAGKLRALSVTGSKRTALAPELPTAAEAGLPGYEAYSWVGFLAPAGTPREIIQKWQQEVSRILQLPEVQVRQTSQGVEPIGSTSEYFSEFIKTELVKWGKVVKDAGIKLD
ncbi:MAG: tripartite tricarboxylate transporter substrate binding protein [Burkholderiaceae bacterium]